MWLRSICSVVDGWKWAAYFWMNREFGFLESEGIEWSELKVSSLLTKTPLHETLPKRMVTLSLYQMLFFFGGSHQILLKLINSWILLLMGHFPVPCYYWRFFFVSFHQNDLFTIKNFSFLEIHLLIKYLS